MGLLTRCHDHESTPDPSYSGASSDAPKHTCRAAAASAPTCRRTHMTVHLQALCWTAMKLQNADLLTRIVADMTASSGGMHPWQRCATHASTGCGRSGMPVSRDHYRVAAAPRRPAASCACAGRGAPRPPASAAACAAPPGRCTARGAAPALWRNTPTASKTSAHAVATA